MDRYYKRVLINIDFINVMAHSIILEGSYQKEGSELPPAMYVMCSTGESYPITCLPNHNTKSDALRFRFKVTLQIASSKETYIMFSKDAEGDVQYRIYKYNRYCAINNVYKNAYYKKEGWLIKIHNGQILVVRETMWQTLYHEFRFACELLSKSHLASIFLRLLAIIYKKFHRRQLWLIFDRVNMAGDNGEALFRHICEKPRKNIRAYFMITSDSEDYARVRRYGKIVPFFSGWDKLAFLLCDCKLSSHAQVYPNNPFEKNIDIYRDLVADVQYVFLQHGVLKDDFSGWLNRYNRNIFGFVVSTHYEKQLVLDRSYEYSEENIWLTGMPRYDRLSVETLKEIYVMPTWRQYLMADKYNIKGERALIPRYYESEYYISYQALLHHPKLQKELQNKGYYLCYAPHPMFKPHKNHMPCSKGVFYDDKTSYKDIFAKAAMVITDYSSIAFDFAYLKKPLLYWHFDFDMFYSGKHTAKLSGYNYKTQGFGEIENDLDSLVERIIEYLQNGCRMKELYANRVDTTFAFHDQGNCERVVQRIISSYPLIIQGHHIGGTLMYIVNKPPETQGFVLAHFILRVSLVDC